MMIYRLNPLIIQRHCITFCNKIDINSYDTLFVTNVERNMVDSSNSKHIHHINQLLHNKGIKQEDRIGVLTSLFETRKWQSGGVPTTTVIVVDARFNDIMDAINAIDFTNKEISQEIFMLFGSKLMQYNLDLFYIPLMI